MLSTSNTKREPTMQSPISPALQLAKILGLSTTQEPNICALPFRQQIFITEILQWITLDIYKTFAKEVVLEITDTATCEQHGTIALGLLIGQEPLTLYMPHSLVNILIKDFSENNSLPILNMPGESDLTAIGYLAALFLKHCHEYRNKRLFLTNIDYYKPKEANLSKLNPLFIRWNMASASYSIAVLLSPSLKKQLSLSASRLPLSPQQYALLKATSIKCIISFNALQASLNHLLSLKPGDLLPLMPENEFFQANLAISTLSTSNIKLQIQLKESKEQNYANN